MVPILQNVQAITNRKLTGVEPANKSVDATESLSIHPEPSRSERSPFQLETVNPPASQDTRAIDPLIDPTKQKSVSEFAVGTEFHLDGVSQQTVEVDAHQVVTETNPIGHQSEPEVSTPANIEPLSNNKEIETKQKGTEFDFGFRKTMTESIHEILSQRQQTESKADVTQIKLQINPPEFGPIEISISHKAGTSTASITVVNERVLNQLQANIQVLETTLDSFNVDLQDVTTFERNSRQDQGRENHQTFQQQEFENHHEQADTVSPAGFENPHKESTPPEIRVGRAVVIDLVV